MAKTAEEFVRESCHITDDTVISNISDAIGASEAFAAQEIEAFKTRLKAEVELRLGNSDEIDPIHKLIDAVK